MCGIHLVICAVEAVATTNHADNLSAELRRRLSGRGPDHFEQLATHLDRDATGGDHRVQLCFSSTVLALRGGGVTTQPFQDGDTGSVLCWNGEAWSINGAQVMGNDGEAVFGLLTDANRRCGDEGHFDSREYRDVAVLDTMRSIEGPFAFLYFDKPARRLYFGRDRLGRRSLLMHYCRDENTHMPQFSLSSVSELQDPRWKEVEADGIYVMDLTLPEFFQINNPHTAEDEPRFVHHSWTAEMDANLSTVSWNPVWGTNAQPAVLLLITSQSLPLERCQGLARSICLQPLQNQSPSIPIPHLFVAYMITCCHLFGRGFLVCQDRPWKKKQLTRALQYCFLEALTARS